MTDNQREAAQLARQVQPGEPATSRLCYVQVASINPETGAMTVRAIRLAVEVEEELAALRAEVEDWRAVALPLTTPDQLAEYSAWWSTPQRDWHDRMTKENPTP